MIVTFEPFVLQTFALYFWKWQKIPKKLWRRVSSVPPVPPGLLLAAGTTATTATPLSSRGIALTHAGVYKGVVAVSTAVQKTEFPTREPSQDIKLVKLVQRYYYYFRYGIQPITSTSWFRHPKCLHHGSNDVVLSVIAEYPRTSRIN